MPATIRSMSEIMSRDFGNDINEIIIVTGKYLDGGRELTEQEKSTFRNILRYVDLRILQCGDKTANYRKLIATSLVKKPEDDKGATAIGIMIAFCAAMNKGIYRGYVFDIDKEVVYKTDCVAPITELDLPDVPSPQPVER